MLKPGKILMGVTLILWGLLLLLVNIKVIPLSMWDQWPTLFIFGGLCMHFAVLDSRSSWGLLIPGMILLVYGALFYVCANVSWRLMETYWPVLIIGIALGLLSGWIGGRRLYGLFLSGGIVLAMGVALLLENMMGWQNIVIPVGLITGGLLVLTHGALHKKGEVR